MNSQAKLDPKTQERSVRFSTLNFSLEVDVPLLTTGRWSGVVLRGQK